MNMRTLAAAGLSAAVLLATPGVAGADAVAEFYRGKTVNLVIGVSPGGGYDLYARLVAAHFGKHIPGQPNVIVQNMPGAGQTRAMRYIYNAAPQDGTYLLGILQTVATNVALGVIEGIDLSRFHWIGRATAIVEVGMGRVENGVRSIEDARRMEVAHAATNVTSLPYMAATLLNKYAGTKFNIIRGYPGSAQMVMALEQGETLASVASWAAIKAGRMDLIRDGKITVIYQVGLGRHADLPDVPTVVELAESERGRTAMRFFSSSAEVGRSYVAAPGTPPERVQALRAAFMAMAKDPALLAEVKQREVDFEPASGEELERIVAEALATPQDLIDEMKALFTE